MTVDQARKLLSTILYDRGDVQAGYSTEGYADVLARALLIVGMTPPLAVTEKIAQRVLDRSHKAARAAGLYGRPFAPADAIKVVLRQSVERMTK